MLSGCTPAGPRAVLKGERLLKQGRAEAAVARLEQAVQLLPREARAWNLLGLAYHASDRPLEAERSYRNALAFDRNLAVARFNLGCLLLEQGQASNAVHELVTFVGLQVGSPSGWLKLGHAQLQARQSAAAEHSFHEVLQLQTNSAPALNGLGVSLVYRRQYLSAWRRFGQALQVDPDYAPALLNAGILAQQYLRDTNLATKVYQRYVAQPEASQRLAVKAILDQWAMPVEPATQTVATTEPAAADATPPAESPADKASAQPTKLTPTRPKPTTTSAQPTEVRTNQAETIQGQPMPEPQPEPQPEEVQPEPEPPPEPEPQVEETPAPATTSKPAEKDTTAASLKPPAPKSQPTETRKPEAAAPPTGATTAATQRPVPQPVPEPPRPPAQEDPPEALRGVEGPRYPYYAFAQPPAGDRNEAIRLLNEGINAQRAFRTREALETYRRAVEVDPSLFETHYNRGVAAFEAGELGEALRAYERALAVNPDSVPARFNFATTLLKSGYGIDAAAQLTALLEAHPDETRAHLALGNLYADHFRNNAQAKFHYRRVLELEPQHPNATSLRFWIEAH